MTEFELEPSPKAKIVKPLEADSLREVMQALRSNSLVAWVERQNTGAMKVGSRFIKFGWRGCSDLLEQLKDGRLLAVECKRAEGGKVKSEQEHFLEMVKEHGGVSFVATSLHDVMENLGRGND